MPMATIIPIRIIIFLQSYLFRLSKSTLGNEGAAEVLDVLGNANWASSLQYAWLSLYLDNIGCVSAEQIQASVIVLRSTFAIFVYINQ